MKRFIVVAAVLGRTKTPHPVWQEFPEGELARHYNHDEDVVEFERDAEVGEFMVFPGGDLCFRHAQYEEETYYFDALSSCPDDRPPRLTMFRRGSANA